MVKPDGVQRGLVGDIVKRFETKGYKCMGLKLFSPTKELLEEHYADLAGKKFFPGLIEYMVRPVQARPTKIVRYRVPAAASFDFMSSLCVCRRILAPCAAWCGRA